MADPIRDVQSQVCPFSPTRQEDGALGEKRIHSISSREERVQATEKEIYSLTEKILLTQQLLEEIQKSSTSEKQEKISAATRLCGVPPGGTQEESLSFLTHNMWLEKLILKEMQSYKDLLTAFTLTSIGAADRDKTELRLSDPLKQLTDEMVTLRNSISCLFQRIIFETLGGPTRRGGRKPGDVHVDLSEIRDFGGSQFSLMYVNLCAILEAFYESLSSEEQNLHNHLFKILFEKLAAAQLFFFMVSPAADASSRLPFTKEGVGFSELAQRAFTQIQSLKRGESMIFPGGSKNHAVLYEVRRQQNEKISFAVFNSDHPLQDEEYPWKRGEKYANRTIHGIEPELVDERFLRKLFSLHIEAKDLEPIYRHLQSLGTLETDSSYHYDQGEVGSCSYQCLLRWLKDQMGKRLYHRLREYTLKGLFNEYVCQFGGQVQDDMRVRTTSHLVPEITLQGTFMNKVFSSLSRSLQKIGRELFIDSALDNLDAIPEGEARLRALQAILDCDEVRKTILNDQDRCLVLVKLSAHLAGRFPHESQFFLDQAIDGAEHIPDPARKSAAFFEIAQSLIFQERVKESSCFLRSAESAEQIADPEERAAAYIDCSKAFFSQKDMVQANHYLDQAADVSKQISDLAKKSTMLERICTILFHWKAYDRAAILATSLPDRSTQLSWLKRLYQHPLSDGNIPLALSVVNNMPWGQEQLIACVEINIRLNDQGDLDHKLSILHSICNPICQSIMLGGEIGKLKTQGNLLKAIEVTRTLPEPDHRAHVLFEIALEMFSAGKESEARALMNEAITAAQMTAHNLTESSFGAPEHYPRWKLFLYIAEAMYFDWNLREGIEPLMEQAIESALHLSAERERSEALEAICETLRDLGRTDRAKEIEKAFIPLLAHDYLSVQKE